MRAVSLFLCLGLAVVAAQAQQKTPAPKINQIAPASQTAEVNLDLHIQPAILVRFPVPMGTDGDQAVGELENRYNEILVSNQTLNRFIQPDDVVIYAAVPPAPKRVKLITLAGRPRRTPLRTAPTPTAKPSSYSIYVLGRRLLCVDAAMAVASGAPSPRALAIRWAKQLQQSLPLLCWRPPNQSEPTVAPDPALVITTDLSQVGGDTGDVEVQGRKAFTLHGVQSDGKTAIDRAEILSHQLAILAMRYGSTLPPAQLIQVQPGTTPGTVALCVGQSTVATITTADAHANGAPSAHALAAQWAAALCRAWPS